MNMAPHPPQERGYYECDICYGIFNYPSILKMHYRSHSVEKPFQCKFCKQSFSFEAHWIIHNKINHNQVQTPNIQSACEISDKTPHQENTMEQCFELHQEENINLSLDLGDCADFQNVTLKQDIQHSCVICNEVFSKECDLHRHLLVHKDGTFFTSKPKTLSNTSDLSVCSRLRRKQRSYTCDSCGETFFEKEIFEFHECIHTEETLSECDKAFSKKEIINDHHRVQEPSNCEKTSTSAEKLNDQHHVHTKERPFMCTQCGKLFSKKSNFISHQRIHTKKKHICSTCGIQFSTKAKLNIHNRSHIKERPFMCTHCGRLFYRKNNFMSHERAHTKRHICSTCGKQFYTKDKLNMHNRVHTKERPFKCTKCGQLFSRKDNLRTHQRVHIHERHFMCDTCGQMFFRKEELNFHYLTHTNERPFMCNTCGKVFPQKNKLTLHHRVHVKIEHFSVVNTVKHLRMFRS